MRRITCVAAMLAVSACAGEVDEGNELDDFRALTAEDLVHKSFRFTPDAGLFDPGDPREGQSATLVVGEVYEKSSAAGFALTSDDGSIQGGVLTLGSCNFDTTFLQLAGREPESGFEPVFFYCGVDDEGRLGLLEDEEEPPIISEPPTEAVPDLDTTVTLSPESLVDPMFDPATRPETGTAGLRLFGNVLSYSVTVADLSTGDEIRDGHIRQGSASENGELLFTLFGSPVQPERASSPPFIEGTSITASIFLTPNEVAVLSDAEASMYIQLTSLQELNGLLRGQLGTASVGPEGGVLKFPNGVILDIPAGALSETIEISVRGVPMDQLAEILAKRRLDVEAKRRVVGAFRIEPDVAFGKTVIATLPVAPPERGEVWRQVDIDREAGEIWPVPTDLEYFAERGVVEMKLPPAVGDKRLAGRRVVHKQATDGTEHGAEGQQWDYESAEEQNDLDERCKIENNQPEACEALDPLQPRCCLLSNVPDTCTCCRHRSFRAQSSATEASEARATESCGIFTDTTIVEYYECTGPDGQPPEPEPHAMGGVSEYCPEDLRLEVDIIAPPPELFVCKTQEYAARIRGALPDGTEVIPWHSFDPIWESRNRKVADFIKNPVSLKFDGTFEGLAEGTTKIWASTGLPEQPYATTSEVEVRSHISEFTLTPSALPLALEHSELISATVVKYDGTPLSASSVRWTSMDSSVAVRDPDVDSFTRVEGVGQGCTEVEAMYKYMACEDVFETAHVCVDCPIVTFSVNSNRDNIAIEGWSLISAEASSSAGVPDLDGVRWATSDSVIVGIAQEVGPATSVYGVGPGRATITAIYEDDCQTRVASSVIDVCPPIAFVPDTATVDVDDTVQLDLRALDGAGDPMAADLSGAVFEISDDEIAEIALAINQTLLIEGLAAGTVTVKASHEGECGTQVAEATVTVQDEGVAGTWNVKVVDGEQSCDIDGDDFWESIDSGDDVEIVDLEQDGDSLTVSYQAFPTATPYTGTISPTNDPSRPYEMTLSVDSSETIDCIKFFETNGAELHYGQPICPEDTEYYQWTCQARSCTENENIKVVVMAGNTGFVGETNWVFRGTGNAVYLEPPYEPVLYEDAPIRCTGEAQLIGCRGSGVPRLEQILGECQTPEDAKALCTQRYGEEPAGAECLSSDFSDDLVGCLYCR